MYKIFGLLLVIGFTIAFFQVDFSSDIRHASRESAHLAPSPKQTSEAVVQVYEAREYKWKGLVATHSWIAVKPSYAKHYTVYQVNRFLVGKQDFSPLEVKDDVPDRLWFGNEPTLVCDLRGKEASKAIRTIKKSVETYPYKNRYDFFPGPNANTFTSYVLEQLDNTSRGLSPLALGKDFHESLFHLQSTPSDTGYQLSIKGFCVFSLAKQEGAFVSLMGFTLGVNPNDKYLILPLVGTIHY